MKSNWLDHVGVYVSEGFYAFNGNLICEDCGKKTIEQLEEDGVEDTGDSNDFPQETSGENESDTPSHCGNMEACVNALQVPGGHKIGCPIRTYLTEEGVTYTHEKILSDILADREHPRRVGRLWLHLYESDFEDVELEKLTSHEIPKILWKSVAPLADHEHALIWSETWTDLSHVYGGAQSPNSMILWRLDIDDLGEFNNLRLVHLPESEATEVSLEHMLREAIESDAWEE